MVFPLEITLILVFTTLIIIISLFFFFTNNSATKERLKVLMENQDNLQKNLVDVLEKSINKIDDKVEKSNDTQNQNIQFIREKIGLIDRAQENINSLTENVVSLKNILSNTNKRGRFGELLLENLVSDQLPKPNYDFQKTLSNNNRVDCVIYSPQSEDMLCIDSKFPRENYEKVSEATTKQEENHFLKKFKSDIIRHIDDVSKKYIIPGETSDIALIFIPSESIYLDIFKSFPDISEISQQKKSFIISPTTLWVILNSIESIVRDKRIKDNAGLIQSHLSALGKELDRLENRVSKLDNHFTSAQDDLNDILTTTKKLSNKTQKIIKLEIKP